MNPHEANLQNDLGVAPEQSGDFAGAAQRYRASLQLRPDSHFVWTNLANALLHGGDAAAALDACREAIRLRASYPIAHNALGCVLLEQSRAVEARDAFREVVRLKADFAQAHANLGLALLTLGHVEQGWREHEWRRREPSPFWQRPGRAWEASTSPLRGSSGQAGQAASDPFGHTIVLYSEGGLGDTIQLIRYAKVLTGMGALVDRGVPAGTGPATPLGRGDLEPCAARGGDAALQVALPALERAGRAGNDGEDHSG